ncbi:MAG: hypothetical protein HY000_17950 [Planctomycetes bacterium]|nr:hypothetical protein [Planctomycetota bacterium]
MKATWPSVRLGEVLTQHCEYIEAPEPRVYPKLSVKLYGKGVVLDAPADGAALKMKRHQLAKAGQVILSEIWGKKGAVGFVPSEGEGALCTSHFFLFDVRTDKLDQRHRRETDEPWSASPSSTACWRSPRASWIWAASSSIRGTSRRCAANGGKGISQASSVLGLTAA